MKGDKEDKSAWLFKPMGLVLTHDGHLYVTENQGGRVFQIAPDGQWRGITGKDIDFNAGDAQAFAFANASGAKLSK